MKINLLKKLAILMAISSISISIIGCGSTVVSSKKETSSSSLETIKKNGKLTIGTSADYPPYEFHKEIDGKDTIVGLDIKIAEAIASDLGVELEIKDMDFDGLLVALQANKIDMAFAAMNPTEERKQNADFSEIYNREKHVFIMRKTEVNSISSMDDLKDKKIGVQKGSVQENLVHENLPNAETKALGKVTDLILDLKNNKVDAILVDLPVGKFNAEKNPDIALTSLLLEDESDGAAIALKKGSDELVTEVNKTISRLKSENKIDEFIIESNNLMD